MTHFGSVSSSVNLFAYTVVRNEDARTKVFPPVWVSRGWFWQAKGLVETKMHVLAVTCSYSSQLVQMGPNTQRVFLDKKWVFDPNGEVL